MEESNKNIKKRKEKNSLGYTVPSNYFDDFQKRLFFKLENEKVADKHRNKLGFKVPENYFETANEQILCSNKPKERIVISFFKTNKWLVSSVAASIAFLLLFNFMNTSKTFENQNIIAVETNLEIDSVNVQSDAILSSILIEDSVINDYVDSYLLEELVIKDMLATILNFENATLASLFIEESTVEDYIESYVIEDLIFENIQNN